MVNKNIIAVEEIERKKKILIKKFKEGVRKHGWWWDPTGRVVTKDPDNPSLHIEYIDGYYCYPSFQGGYLELVSPGGVVFSKITYESYKLSAEESKEIKEALYSR